jgi:hypothetical protein
MRSRPGTHGGADAADRRVGGEARFQASAAVRSK